MCIVLCIKASTVSRMNLYYELLISRELNCGSEVFSLVSRVQDCYDGVERSFLHASVGPLT